MNPLSDCGIDQEKLFIGHSDPAGGEGEMIHLRSVGWTSVENKVQFQHQLIRERNINLLQGELSGTNFDDVVRLMPPAVLRSDIDRLKSLYIFQNPSKAEEVLKCNRTVVKMISSIYTKIRKEFPSERILLEAISDYPSSQEKDIVISVSTSLPVDEAIDRLDKVENVRWNKSSPDPYVNVCVKLDYL